MSTHHRCTPHPPKHQKKLKHALIIPGTPLTTIEISSTILHISQLTRVPKTVTDALIAVATLLRHMEIDILKQHLIDAVMEGIAAKLEHQLTQFDLTNDILDANANAIHTAIDSLENIKQNKHHSSCNNTTHSSNP